MRTAIGADSGVATFMFNDNEAVVGFLVQSQRAAGNKTVASLGSFVGLFHALSLLMVVLSGHTRNRDGECSMLQVFLVDRL